MKLKVLETALAYLQLHVNDGYFEELNIDDVDTAIKELVELRAMFTAEDNHWDSDDAKVIGVSSLIDILNQLTYDTYGIQARLTGGFVTFKEYAESCRKLVMGCEYMADNVLREGYDFVSHLWYENEALGFNKPDGTFDKDKF